MFKVRSWCTIRIVHFPENIWLLAGGDLTVEGSINAYKVILMSIKNPELYKGNKRKHVKRGYLKYPFHTPKNTS
jgi:hypothetical protein